MKTHSIAACAAALVLAFGAVEGLARDDRTRVIALHYDQRLKDKGFASPILTARVAGRDVLFVVDTGAGVDLLASWFVKAARLELDHRDSFHVGGFSGRSVDLSSVHDVDLVVSSGDTIRIAQAVVVNLPSAFEENAIAGVVSPQLFVRETQSAVLDLTKPELRIEDMQSAIDRYHALVLSRGALTRVCTQSRPATAHPLYTVRATVAGVETSLIVDTGAATTSLIEGTPAARAALRTKPIAAGTSVGVDGHRVRLTRSAPVEVDFGGGPQRMSVDIGVTAAPCASQGGLGMNALAACTWIFGRSALAISCKSRK